MLSFFIQDMPQMQKVKIRTDTRFHVIGNSKSGHNVLQVGHDTHSANLRKPFIKATIKIQDGSYDFFPIIIST